MGSDINRLAVGVLCRDFGFLPHVSEGFQKVEVRIDNAYLRKGNQKYAQQLTEQLVSWHPEWFDEIVVVGDGEGDVWFCTKLDNLSAPFIPTSKISGFFIRHQALERFQNESENLKFYDSWEELSSSLSALLVDINRTYGTLSRTLILADIDRTILFPRLKCDGHYFRTRMEGIVDYVLGFAVVDNPIRFAAEISAIAEFVTSNLVEYTNELNDLCFKNEEAVAVGTLLLSIGTVLRKWLRPPNCRSLSDMLRYSIQKLEHGGWISGLGLEQSQGRRGIAGESMWKRNALTEHLASVLSNLRENKPVICPEFRWHEAAHVKTCIARHGSNIFNVPLLNAMKSAIPASILFVSDRPAQSLGFSPENRDGELGGGTFWVELQKHLFEPAE